jgi:hypothetical protein
MQIIIRVTEEERALIEEKMRQIPTLNLSAYARKILIDGYIITLDLREVKGHTAQLQKIISQILRFSWTTDILERTSTVRVGKLRYEHEMRLKAKRDRRAEDKFVYVQGQKDGIEIGKAQGFSVLIDYMRNNGLSDEQIITELMVKYGLSRDDAADMLH